MSRNRFLTEKQPHGFWGNCRQSFDRFLKLHKPCVRNDRIWKQTTEEFGELLISDQPRHPLRLFGMFLRKRILPCVIALILLSAAAIIILMRINPKTYTAETIIRLVPNNPPDGHSTVSYEVGSACCEELLSKKMMDYAASLCVYRELTGKDFAKWITVQVDTNPSIIHITAVAPTKKYAIAAANCIGGAARLKFRDTESIRRVRFEQISHTAETIGTLAQNIIYGIAIGLILTGICAVCWMILKKHLHPSLEIDGLNFQKKNRPRHRHAKKTVRNRKNA